MTIFAIIILLLTVWFWSNSMRAREAALVYGARICQFNQWQFLDDTVVFRHLSIKRLDGRLVFVRTYTFDYYSGAQVRMMKKIILYGNVPLEPEKNNVIHFPIQ